MDEQKLEELAVQEILKDLKRGAERAKEHGALGWQKNPVPPTNKRFLRNMLVSTLRDNRPFKHNRNSDEPNSSHLESSPRRTSESETYFRYNDRYRQNDNNLDKRNDQRKDLCSDSQSHNSGSSLQPEYSGKSLQGSSQHAAAQEIDISDFNHRCLHHKKRSWTSSSSSSDSEFKEKSEENERKKRKREHHGGKGVDGRHSSEKKKYKKSKKSKKHKSKHSKHSSKHRS